MGDPCKSVNLAADVAGQSYKIPNNHGSTRDFTGLHCLKLRAGGLRYRKTSSVYGHNATQRACRVVWSAFCSRTGALYRPDADAFIIGSRIESCHAIPFLYACSQPVGPDASVSSRDYSAPETNVGLANTSAMVRILGESAPSSIAAQRAVNMGSVFAVVPMFATRVPGVRRPTMAPNVAIR